MTTVDFLKLGAFLIGLGLGTRMYMAYKKAERLVQDDTINKQKNEVEALQLRADSSKKEFEANLESWNDFVNRTRDVSKRGEGK